MIRLHKHRVFRSVLAVWLALLVLSGTALPAHASLTGKNTVKAVQEYAAYIRKTAKSSGLASVPKRPLRTRGQMELFRLIKKEVISDGFTSGMLARLKKALSSKKEQIRTCWSILRTNNPLICYDTGSYYDDTDGRWYGYIYDSPENYSRYKHDNRALCRKAVSDLKARFKKQLAAYRKKYGAPDEAEKVALVLNFVVSYLRYGTGWVSHKGKDLYAGGDLYTAWLTRYGVCSDYSNLFYELCACVGIECYRVAGEIRLSSSNMDAGFHQWNLVRIGKKYYYIDPTNDDKVVNSGVGYSRHYFGARLNRLFYSGDAYLIF